MTTTFRKLGRTIALATTAIVVAAGLTVLTPAVASAADVPSTPAPVQERNAGVVTADPLPAPQIENGFIWTQVTIGNVVYAAGQFQNVRPAGAAPGTSLIPRSNILAFDITTGALLPFAPAVNGTIRSLAVSADGSRLYIGGSFNKVGSDPRWNFAALNPATGAPVPGFSPAIGGTSVNGIAVTGDTVYVDGLFTQANGVARKNYAAFATSNGALRDWAPVSDLQADALVIEPGGARVIAAGRFSTVNNVTQRGLVALDPVSGAIDTGWAAPQTVINGAGTGSYTGKAGIFTLTTDDNGVYGTGWSYAPWSIGNLEGVFAADAGTGAIRWVADCHGDHYGVFSTGSTVYATSHTHACETTGLHPELSPRQYRYMEAFTAEPLGTLPRSQTANSTYMDWSGTPSPGAYTVAPDFTVGTTSGLGQAGLSITGAGDFISVAGEFTSVNNQQYQGIVRFATEPASGAKQGPRLTGSAWTAPVAQSTLPGRVQVSVPTNWDRDNRDLTYELLRDGVSAPVATLTTGSFWWKRTNVRLDDSTAPPGSAQTYRVRVRDADGNAVTSAATSVTVQVGTSMPYANAVLDDGASLYYPLGSVRQDWAGADQPIFGSGVSTTSPGAVTGASADASSFSGTSSARVSSTNQITGPNEFTQELWFKTDSTRGGKLLGFGNSRTGTSSSYDRHLYMSNDGRITFGVYPNEVKTIRTSDAYNDNDWHHVVASLGADGMALYVDGALTASETTVTSAQSYQGYWRIGGDALGSWPNSPTSTWFRGAIDEVAIYPTVLSASQIAAHFAAGKGQEAPAPAFTATAAGLTVAFDGSASTTPSGAITEYSWNFGDDSTASGATVSHTYAEAGTYTTTLTVKDSRGLLAATTQDVIVQAPNTPPVAAIETDVQGLTVSADASGSTDEDGPVSTYGWDWGDGSAPSTGVTASHKYAAAGAYTVTLTVEDEHAATDTSTAQVVATHDAPSADATVSPSGLDVTVDGSASTGFDDATLSYAWSWGDGSADGVGSTAAHTYAEPGSYTVTLTVTDNYGSTGSTTRQVTASRVLFAASDDFERSVGSGWGTADIGGGWTAMYGAASAATVSGGVGVISAAPGVTLNLAQQGVPLVDSSSAVEFALDSAPTTGSTYVGLTARQRAGADYTVRAWMRNDGSVWLVAQRSGTVLVAQRVAGATWAGNDRFHLLVEAEGTSPTTIRAKIWKVGSAEPTSWQVSTTDATAALQSAGYGAVHVARTGSATSTTNVSFDAYRVTDLSVPQVQLPVAALVAAASYLDVSVDGTGSHATNADITDYVWTWGDGTADGSGATATHTYAEAGTYTVELTVTDEYGQHAGTTSEVTVAENQAPTAAFVATPSGLLVAADASASTDPEGAALTYSWSWGDGTDDTEGAAASHIYAAAGAYDVTLIVTDEKGLEDTSTQTVTVVNAAPTATFTTSSTGLSVTADGSGSQDPDGEIAEYRWNWGDGSAETTGASAEHAYAAAGTYEVTLTVTDANGTSATASNSVTVSDEPVETFLASDDFERTTAGGWGTADTGGAWSVLYGSASVASTAEGKGKVTLGAGSTRNLMLNSTTAHDVLLTADFSLSTSPSEGSTYVGLVARASTTDNYTVRSWMHSNGSVWIVIQRGSTVLKTYVVPGITRVAGDSFTLKVQVTGAMSTTIDAKLWRTGTEEPAGWQVSATDATGLDAAGSVGIHMNRSGAATTPGIMAVDGFRVTSLD